MTDSGNTDAVRVWGPWATAGFACVVLLGSEALVYSLILFVRIAYDPTFVAPLDILESHIWRLHQDLNTLGFTVALNSCATSVVGVGLILVIIKRRRGATIAEYLALNPVSRKMLLVLLAVSIGVMLLTVGLRYLLGIPPVDGLFMFDESRIAVWPALWWFGWVIAGPAFEEILFRGFLLEGFRRSRMGNIGAVGLTALIWTLLHLGVDFYDTYQLGVTFALGVLFGIVRIKTRSLWSCLFMHAFWNLVPVTMTVLYVYGLVEL